MLESIYHDQENQLSYLDSLIVGKSRFDWSRDKIQIETSGTSRTLLSRIKSDLLLANNWPGILVIGLPLTNLDDAC